METIERGKHMVVSPASLVSGSGRDLIEAEVLREEGIFVREPTTAVLMESVQPVTDNQLSAQQVAMLRRDALTMAMQQMGQVPAEERGDLFQQADTFFEYMAYGTTTTALPAAQLERLERLETLESEMVKLVSRWRQVVTMKVPSGVNQATILDLRMRASIYEGLIKKVVPHLQAAF